MSSSFNPSGSANASTSSPKRIVGPVKSMSPLDSFSTQEPMDSRGIAKEVTVTWPFPWRPLRTPGHGKKVRIVPGRPWESP